MLQLCQTEKAMVTELPGSLLCKPRDVAHTFWNPSDAEARLLEIVVPATLDG